MRGRAAGAALLLGASLLATPARAATCTTVSTREAVTVPAVGRTWVGVWESTCPTGTRVARIEVTAPRPVQVLAALYAYRRPPLRTVVTWRGATPTVAGTQVLRVGRTLPAGPSPVGAVGLDIYQPGHGAAQVTIQIR